MKNRTSIPIVFKRSTALLACFFNGCRCFIFWLHRE